MSAVADHIAIEVGDLDGRVHQLVSACGMRVLRQGTRWRTGQRIVMLGDGTGFKVELIESAGESPTLIHLAFRVPDADQTHSDLIAQGWQDLSPPHELPAAMARTALVGDGRGLVLQVVTYGAGSPDMQRWVDENPEQAGLLEAPPLQEDAPGRSTTQTVGP